MPGGNRDTMVTPVRRKENAMFSFDEFYSQCCANWLLREGYCGLLNADWVHLETMELCMIYYASESIDKDEQMNSLDNQKTYFAEKIKNASKRTFVSEKFDKGITGDSIAERNALGDD